MRDRRELTNFLSFLLISHQRFLRLGGTFHMAFSEMCPVSKQPAMCLYEVIASLVMQHLVFLSQFPCFTSLSVTLVALRVQLLITCLHVNFASNCFLGQRYLYFCVHLKFELNANYSCIYVGYQLFITGFL